MKIAIDCRMLSSGGIGTYLQSLLPFFIKNYECTLLLKSKDLDTYKNISNLKTLLCDITTFSIKELISFPQSLLKEINSCDAYYSPYCNIPGGIKVPVFSTIHDVVFLDVKGLSGKIGTIARKWFYQHAINRSTTIFTVSQFSKERIEHHLKTKKVPVIVTYNAVPHWFKDGVEENISKKDTILFVGNIKKHKGLHTLVAAYKKLLSSDFPGKLMIVGNASNFRTSDDSISQELNSLPEDSVIYTGRISDNELKTKYAEAKLLIQPSLYEGFGMPPMEALTLGTNVVISDIPVFKEIYKDLPVTYFKTDNAEDLANKIKSAYNQKVPEFTNPYSFEKTFDIINNTLN